MSIDRRLLNWGIFLVILGAIPVAVNQGWLARESLARAWQLWPLVLVGIGVGLVFARTRAHFLGGLVVAGTFGVVLGALVAGAFTLGSFGCGGGTAAADTPAAAERQGQFGSQATITLRMDCGSLTVAPSAGAGWTLRATGDPERQPDVIAGSDTLVVRSHGDVFILPFLDGQGAAWSIGLPAGPLLDVRADLNAADGHLAFGGLTASSIHLDVNAGGTRLDLAEATVGSLDVAVNAGDLRVTLPSTLAGAIRANAATVRLCAPAGAGLRLTVAGSVETDNFAGSGLVASGHTWERPGTASGAQIVDLRLDGNAVSYTLEGPEGCR